MNISSTSICNEALVFLGETPLLGFPEPSTNSDRCLIFYNRVYEAELTKHPWNETISRSTLTLDSIQPVSEYRFQFILPPGCLRILNVYPLGCKWKREGLRLLTNQSPIDIRYIANIPESELSAMTAVVISAKLAVLLAQTLTERPEKLSQAAAWYDTALREARNIDSIESSIDEWEDTSVVYLRQYDHHTSFFYRPISF